MTGARAILLTHAEVVMDPTVPVPDWPLSEKGRARHVAFAGDPALARVSAIVGSRERKARDAAELHAASLGLRPRAVTALHENDRSATGYLPPPEFEAVADAFFAAPDRSIRGWETARAAQARVVAAIRTIRDLRDADAEGDVLIVAHGGIGALLRCDLLKVDITRREDQPGTGGGCWFAFDLAGWSDPTGWRAI